MREAGAQLAVLFGGERLRRQARDEQRAQADGVALDRVAGDRRRGGGRRGAVSGDVRGRRAGHDVLRAAIGSGAGGVGMSIVIGTVARLSGRATAGADAAVRKRGALALGLVENVLNTAHLTSPVAFQHSAGSLTDE